MKRHHLFSAGLSRLCALAGLVLAGASSLVSVAEARDAVVDGNASPDDCCGKYTFGPDYPPVLQAQRSTGAPAQSFSSPTVAPSGRRAPRVLQSFTNATGITITDCPNPCPASGQAASLYPSPIVVAGVPGVVERVSVRLNGFTHAFPADVDFLLESPSGRKVVIMSDFGAGSPGVAGINITLDDYAERPIPSTVTGNTGIAFTTGTYRPGNSGTTDVFPAPAPAGPYSYSLSHFNGDNPNGTWKLYIIDDANLDGGVLSGGWTISFDSRPAPPAPGDILISEFRTRGEGTTPPGSDGSADEYIELYNNTDSSITIIDAIPGADALGGGVGWRLSVADGGTESGFILIPQTSSTAGPITIPGRGHFLVAIQPPGPVPAGNTYSLSTYPTGTGITASGSPNLPIVPANTAGLLPDNCGLALFSTAAVNSANRLDSVGFNSVTNGDYFEGSPLPSATGITTPSQHAWIRKAPGGIVKDTGDNAADFQLVSTTGNTLDGIASILGAPGPERSTTNTAFTTTGSPVHDAQANNMTIEPVDPQQPLGASPNAVFESSTGTLRLRVKVTNNGPLPLIALRYRVSDLSTKVGGVVPAGKADLRLTTSPLQNVSLTDGSIVVVNAATLQTPAAQPLGGGVNSSVTQGVITTTSPLASGASTNVEFAFNVQAFGNFRLTLVAEASTTQHVGASGIFTATGSVGAGDDSLIVSSGLNDVAFTAPKKAIDIDVTSNDPDPLGGTITIVGQPTNGTVTVVNGKIRYVPKSTFPPGGDSFTYSYNGLVATVRIVNYATIAGGFDGLAADNGSLTQAILHERSGRVQAVISKTGTLTGTVFLGGVKRGSIKGTLGVTGSGKFTFQRKPEAPITVALRFEDGFNRLLGNVQSTDFFGDGFASRILLGRKTGVLQLARRYTMRIAADPSPKSPQGDGYAAVNITTAGDVALVGKLADGTPFTTSSYLRLDNTFPFYLPLYPTASPRGSMRGDLAFLAVPGDATGSLLWFKAPRPLDPYYPGGFILNRGAFVGRYSPPPANTRILSFDPNLNNGRVLLYSGGLLNTVDQTFTLPTNNKVTVATPNPTKMTLKFIPATGVFQGSFTNAVNNKKTVFEGAVQQGVPNATGFFRGAGPYDGGGVVVEKKP